MNTITLSGKGLVELLDFLAPDREQDPEQLEQEVSFVRMDEAVADGLGPGVYAYLTDDPEKALYGPLGGSEG